ncbi:MULTISPECIES: DNA translocase FtsK [Ensifer]|jgi:DNA segregation ATPase FtsK/SpoIIIE, S-DNA-T family|uniref:DNA translocase FtsK n=1 Tax=Ensifer canadensis TaxID=555315 RepID=A0AAW4FUN8_9HYPH|nr:MULTISPECIES: DNA translocase FtsK [Ensifer]AHK42710.1 DNA translocase FtsK [Ensifer adhaerens OV14]MDP9631910.1 S-DNA-T family DNA segregation ATPase FtsK/SpoIIIE [Ensifer adhaerens]KQU77414.1 cell division protein FtsK [Ensifer sp. Root31]KQW34465.1 cell division protein FtsK [Ensifer sp. Root1252]KQW56253.1 cell division protein FtsK [Ensifer sp. Root127]
MSRSNPATLDSRSNRFVLTTFVWRQIASLAGFALFGALALAIAALSTWNVADPSFSYATSDEPTNVLGYAGAAFADIFMQFFGLASVVALLPAVAWALVLIGGKRFDKIFKRLGLWFVGSVLAGAALSCVPAPITWPLPNGLGGVFGDMILRFPALFTGAFPTGTFATVLACIFAAPAAWCLIYSAGLIGVGEEEDEDEIEAPTPSKARTVRDELDEDDSEGPFTLLMGSFAHLRYTVQARVRRIFGMSGTRTPTKRQYDEPYDFNNDEFGTLNEPVRPKPMAGDRIEPSLDRSERRIVTPPPIMADDDDDMPFDMDERRPAGILSDDEDDDLDAAADWAPKAAPPKQGLPKAGSRVATPPPRPKTSQRLEREAQRSFVEDDDGDFALPPMHFLAEPKNVTRDASLSADALEQNARMLEGVLEDFGVKGEIIHVRPGPVVTLYELEPAPGIKSSRVIGLADDIARSMSAIAARVAVVPGRNAIGIELPNQRRETVYLRELIGSRDFETSKARLAMALGKTIGGEPVVADLAKMPHLLVAGTTGSGKSVAINTMILSLLYRLRPDQCRLIMIDPKMLELSVYDGIPHLLSPVVTDPKKAVVALKWTVREMEERYKKMSKIGVRNIDGFNTRVEQALAKGDAITRTVQTGFDRQTGEAIYETEEFDLSPMPYIVVIIDEMADLMMVAGKDIEGAVQRLAQMARAAGIHVIMATQRPSVDVITGTIKANFPTRISFQVTSKIDSRTILGEQGAEQLLGMGDMLYMAGGGRIQRVHGPFVSDTEVEEVVAYLKTQGTPQYLDAITEDDDEDNDGGGPAGTSNLADSDDPYDQAVAIVLRDGKASTSYVQRRLGIGYNRAASLIERMEQEGIIGPANHAGKREILVPTEAEITGR